MCGASKACSSSLSVRRKRGLAGPGRTTGRHGERRCWAGQDDVTADAGARLVQSSRRASLTFMGPGSAQLRHQDDGSGGAGLIGKVVLDRPEAMNALDTATLAALAEHFTALGGTRWFGS